MPAPIRFTPSSVACRLGRHHAGYPPLPQPPLPLTLLPQIVGGGDAVFSIPDRRAAMELVHKCAPACSRRGTLALCCRVCPSRHVMRRQVQPHRALPRHDQVGAGARCERVRRQGVTLFRCIAGEALLLMAAQELPQGSTMRRGMSMFGSGLQVVQSICCCCCLRCGRVRTSDVCGQELVAKTDAEAASKYV